MAELLTRDEFKFKLRSYQEEMLEISLRENIIVKMDTGTGKTAIAVARAEDALTSSAKEKIVWLLAPTVPLCTQHYETFQKRLPGYQVRLLIGSDGIDRWSDQQTWDAALKNIRVVISVGAVLRDALDHAFVNMENIALIIFDEAHRCVKKDPAVMLMRNWYFRTQNEKRPKILGLSASIVKPSDLEAALNAKVITPTRSRSELLRHANRPVLQYLRFNNNQHLHSQKFAMLRTVQSDYEITVDPYFRGLSAAKQEDFLSKGKPTVCLKELRVLYQRTTHVFEQLGPSMADWYLDNSVGAILTRLESMRPQSLEMGMTVLEAVHLSSLLRPFQTAAKKNDCDGDNEKTFAPYLSPKLGALIEFLENEWSETFTGLIFVQQRVLAYILAYFLSQYKFERASLRVQSFVGTSRVQDPAKRLVEQILPKDQKGVLEKFRSPQREINLLVATEVLGEGVDIPQCHLVVCFDTPPQITSYVQKRGRARMKDSKYVLMLEDGEDDAKFQKWQVLEAELEEAYLVQERAWLDSQQLEEREDESPDVIEFRVRSTGALLDMNNAVAKLHHVCQSSRTGGVANLQPQFSCEEHPDRTITATVTLPLTIEPAIRVTKSSKPWLTEKMAKREAAFNSLRKLYEHGLLTEHLLPPRQHKEDLEELGVEKTVQQSFCAILSRVNPWLDAAQSTSTKWHTLDVVIKKTGIGQQTMVVTVLAPVPLPALPDFVLKWNHNIQYNVSGRPSSAQEVVGPHLAERMRLETDAILRLVSGTRMAHHHHDFPFCVSLPATEMIYWQTQRKFTSLSTNLGNAYDADGTMVPGIVWHENRRYLFHAFARAKLQQDGNEVEVIEVTAFPKRTDFLHAFFGEPNSYTTKYQFAASECTLEPWSLKATMASLFIPAVLHRIGLAMVTQKLRTTLIPHLRDESLPLLQAALTSREAREQENYERLEFFGDAYINFLVSLNLMVERRLWPEGYLTNEKGRLVSNDMFCEAALFVGLDEYITMKEFTGRKWKPPYVHELLAESQEERGRTKSSKKRMADVIEATVAVAYLDGGHDGAIQLCRKYFPMQMWKIPEQRSLELFDMVDDNAVHLQGLENLIGYTFAKPKLLLEAITSSSYKGGDPSARSYERIEFLGDAILDYLVVQRIYGFKGRELPNHAMHSIKSAAVNSWILGYLCMEFSILEERKDIATGAGNSSQDAKPKVKQAAVSKHIWQYIRPGYRTEKEQESLRKFVTMREEIKHAFEGDRQYPWALLSGFNPSKAFSDVIESILGAIFIDSRANNDECNAFLDRIGLIRIIDHLLGDDVACMHPKELLGIAAKHRSVNYVYGEEDKMFTCHVLIDGKQVGGVARGETKDVVSTLAAVTAVEIEQQGRMYDMVEKVWKAVTEDELIPGISTVDGDETVAGELDIEDID